MTLANAALWAVTVLYAVQAAVNFANGNPAHGVIVSGYTLANLGLIWSLS